MASRATRGREGKRAKKARVRRIVAELRELYPEATTALRHSNPFELLIATILSAQCTDARVNLVTPRLFERYPTMEALAAAPVRDIEAIIHSTGFYRNKARNIQGVARALLSEHGGRVPASMDELVKLPGVGRKTANVVLGNAFGEPAIAVDTHVKRLSGRLGLSSRRDPEGIERDLMELTPREDWTFLSHGLILHGRRVCKARRPACADCSLRADCPSASRSDP